ncbi:MAG: hypothetical protein E3J83_06305 [Candidatus Atribacteria bacterium]|nr:MAG: hypothetical protein E3J83_06305 [Candidatus Atribacteria bacterium]
MGKFLESEKIRQANLKVKSPYFSKTARKDGIYSGKPRPFCLPVDCAEENLFFEIRQNALKYFDAYKIKWHDRREKDNLKLSNHLCDSQICCVNFLFPFAQNPDILADFLRPIFPNLQKMLPIENNQYVAFEWTGLKDHLGETKSHSGKCTRGANCTSADAVVMFKRSDGKQQMVLIEWKYTESYRSIFLRFATSGTDRTKTYKPFYIQGDCPINKELLPSFDSLFYEPFYQFMRQQLLAREIEKARELENDVVSVLHIAPALNTDFYRITSPKLSKLGEKAIDVWKSLVPKGKRFISVSTERLFCNLFTNHSPEIQAWVDYITKRYAWVQIGSMDYSRYKI